MATTSYSEQRKTNSNYNSPILEARVIANYGDPGLDEDYHFDILSRYVVVKIESCNRVATSDKYPNMFAIVKRPESLWIQASSTPNGNAAFQQRKDFNDNISVGIAGAFSTAGISRIYPSYALGETIKIRKISVNIQPPNDSFFYSKFSAWDATVWGYGGWHSDGSTLPYFTTDLMKSSLRQKTISPVSTRNYYGGFLNKLQYEAFALTISQGNTSLTNSLTSIFDKSWAGNPAVYSANGGYLFDKNQYILLNTVSYEDTNIAGKARVASNECVPLIVTSPVAFPMPGSRAIGSIAYNPTYSPVSIG